MNNICSVIVGYGSYLPERVVTNHELAKNLATSDEWIVKRTGISQRHIVAENEYTSDIAYYAACRALETAKLQPQDIDLIIVATTTPDYTCPSTATQVQARLGIHHGAAFDLQAVCSGFVYALTTADAMLRCGQFKCCLVIGADTFSRIIDWQDRATCVLFGDGAGCVILEAQDKRNENKGILATHIRSEGHLELFRTSGGPSRTSTTGVVQMMGNEMFRHAVANLTSIVKETLDLVKLTPADIDWIIPHQANMRIINSTANHLGIGLERVVITVNNHANTSAASIPLALVTAITDGRVKPGDLILLEAMGAGLTWGACLVRM